MPVTPQESGADPKLLQIDPILGASSRVWSIDSRHARPSPPGGILSLQPGELFKGLELMFDEVPACTKAFEDGVLLETVRAKE